MIPKYFPVELEDKILFWMDNNQDSQLHLIINLNGFVDYSILQKAVRLAIDIEPVMGCRFVVRHFVPYWERLDNLDEIEHVHLVETGGSDDELFRFLSDVWVETTLGPQIKVWVIRSDSDIICIKVSHVAMDAAAIKDLAYLLASTYNELIKNPHFTPGTAIKKNRSFRQVSKHFSTLDKFKIIRRTVRDFASYAIPLEPPHAGETNRKPSDRCLILKTFDSGMFKAVKEFGRRNNATVNDIMVAVFIKSFYETVNPDSRALQRLLITCDLRRYIPSGNAEAFCNLSGFIYVNVGKNRKLSLKEIICNVRDQMNRLKNDCIGMGNLPISMALFKIMPFPWALWIHDRISDFLKRQIMSTGSVSPLFTNTGIIDHNRIVFNDVKPENAHINAIYSYPPVLSVSLNGFKDTLTLTSGFCSNTVDEAMVKLLFEMMEQNIVSLHIH